MRFVSGWRLALRLAWREAWRSKARSVLMVVMVTFPVVAVVAADVAQATQSVSSVEGLDRRIGSAEAKITALPNSRDVTQIADPDSGGFTAHPSRHQPAPSLEELRGVLGGDRPAIELREHQPAVRTDLGALRVDALAVDLTSPLSHGLVRLTSGHLPTTGHEVAINAALAGHGFGIGDRLTLTDGTAATVVGIAESAGERTFPFFVAPPTFFPTAPPGAIHDWLVGGAPVTWDQVRALNHAGALVLSRQVVEHPPSADQLPPGLGQSSDHSTIYVVLALVGVMVLIEVVLLAGPAFAVGARRQSRSLALIAANGGTPAQSRRVILGAAVVIGAFSALAGIVLGIGAGRVLVPILQSTADTWFGPFQIRWDHVLGIAAFGLVSAFLAAVVPAWIASRQDVVAVLAGRRGDRAASRRSPFIGLALTAAGVVLAVLGARRDSGELLIAGAAVLSVLGMIFLVPVTVLAVARLGRRFPLPLRYAVRDASRHRTRTVPAVAAVAATVAGVVALSIGNTSDQAQAKAEYVAEYPMGTAAVNDYAHHQTFVASAAEILRKAGADPAVVQGVASSRRTPTPRLARSSRRWVTTTSDLLGADALVADALPPMLPDDIDATERKKADATLARGGVVLFAQRSISADHVTVRSTVSAHHRRHTTSSASLPAYVVDTGTAYGPASMVLSPSAARRLALPVEPAAVLFDADRLSPPQLDAAEQGIQALSPEGASIYVERGYQVASSEKVVLWILFGLAGVLMLGGTLTATFLALSDARPDLATLSAVGASPRMRRAVAAAYALSVGVVGALLGAAVGLVPGIAVSYPLTRPYNVGDPGPSHYLAIPWLEIVGLVVLLPLVTALVVGLVARSRLPLVARLD